MIVRCDGFDYLDLPFDYSEKNTLPKDFRGVSGGGLWSFRMGSSDGGKTMKVINRTYCGVAFYQSEIGEDKIRTIRHHFVTSIYGEAREAILGKET